MKKILLTSFFSLIMLSFSQAQTILNRTALQNQTTQSVTSNGAGGITGLGVRTLFQNNFASVGLLNDTNAWTGNNSFTISPTGPTGTINQSSNSLATQAFVINQINNSPFPSITAGVLGYIGIGTGSASSLTTLPSALTIPSPIVTGSFLATGLVTNSDLTNSSLTLGTTVATLGATTTSISGLTFNNGTLSGTIAGTPTFSGNNFITLGNIIQDSTSYSLLGNPTVGASDYTPFTIGGLALKASPASTDLVMIQDQAAGGALKYSTVSEIAAGGGGTVMSITPGAGISSTPAAGGTTAITTTGILYTDASYLPNHLGGLVLSNDGTSPNTVLDIEAGAATDSTNTYFIKIGTFTKSTAGAWAAGSGSNGMGNGLTITASTWYHVCLAYNNNSSDIWFDTSATCANKPSGITGTYYRRIGSFKTNGSSQIIAFSQNGDEFLWLTPTNDVNNQTLGTTATLYTLNVPLGVKVNALMNWYYSGVTIGNCLMVNSPDVTSLAGGSLIVGTCTIIEDSSSAGTAGGILNVRTNTSQQVRAVSGIASSTVYEATMGWIDTRGKLN